MAIFNVETIHINILIVPASGGICEKKIRIRLVVCIHIGGVRVPQSLYQTFCLDDQLELVMKSL